jgi:hypothetical protein
MHTLDIDMSFVRLPSGAVKNGLWCQRWMKMDGIVGKQWFRFGVEAIDRHLFDSLGRLWINPAWSHGGPAVANGDDRRLGNEGCISKEGDT